MTIDGPSKSDVGYLVVLRKRTKRALLMARLIGYHVHPPERELLLTRALFSYYRAYQALGLEAEGKVWLESERQREAWVC